MAPLRMPVLRGSPCLALGAPQPGLRARPGRGAAVVRAAKTADGPSVAIAGVTGAVGQEFLRVLKERDFPYSKLKPLASARSAGKHVQFDGQDIVVEELTADSFKDVDIALFSAGGSITKKFAQAAIDSNCMIVDNSSAFRMTDGVPLIIPEVNGEDMAGYKVGKGGIIANPNCSTIIALMAVTPLHKAAGVERMVISTYQAASGAGQAAMDELVLQMREFLDGKEVTKEIFPLQYAFNLFSHNSPITDTGYNEEEMKMVKETHKIWKDPDVKVTATCIRVPVMRAHAESINLQLKNPLTESEARAALNSSPGVSIIDDRENNRFPTPLDATSRDDVYVGRVRRDISRGDDKGLDLFVCGDQIKKGAALNAVQIAELLL
ncbi:unnamed protein product [Ostreobium quekettii]|uniref:aspartate-semialdehyde dehydrogenase n=1 Tax=Ostreobium quekettii TaxID=121088 RepID=A0A8S1JBR0_9CHLO|nr:unnamed protein product [Ostreobium quekettii]|eukprot:evm.model.scf_1302.7 EVM.evm.TU.scf_1302.7   scf_1302:32505-35442(-)